ncbi:unnamed protein product [Pleuronectes platessa]|uniref:Uncharacterized protein n=1 Tax=Pleuronectes platessa TaxID=8262 RepID=A0A9N7VKD7_PLEPL|nr:unnamed protein product [Pleuronectes platessa]
MELPSVTLEKKATNWNFLEGVQRDEGEVRGGRKWRGRSPKDEKCTVTESLNALRCQYFSFGRGSLALMAQIDRSFETASPQWQ